MKNHMQTIINVCFAIFITVHIIQDDKLNEQIELLNEEVEAANIGLIKTLYSASEPGFICGVAKLWSPESTKKRVQ